MSMQGPMSHGEHPAAKLDPTKSQAGGSAKSGGHR